MIHLKKKPGGISSRLFTEHAYLDEWLQKVVYGIEKLTF